MSQHKDAVTRAVLPEVMFTPDVATALRVTEETARKAIVRGECGPHFRIGRRLAVLRESFLAALARRQEIAPPRLVEGCSQISDESVEDPS